MEDLLCGNLAEESTMELVSSIFQLCWAIWKAMNGYVFKGKLPSPDDTIEKASIAHRDSLQAAFLGTTVTIPKPPRESNWSPPSSVLKFNCDGAYFYSCSKAAFGIIARETVVD